jgi:hypothetical protein
MRAVMPGLCALAMACGSSQPPLHAAGSDGDEGHGIIGQQSIQLLTPEETEREETEEERRAREYRGYEYDYEDRMEEEDSAAFGGDAYGGSVYGGYVVRPWPVSPPRRAPDYAMESNLAGAIEGTISWKGAVPAKLTTKCGSIEPLRVSKDNGLAGVVVYIESVKTGRVVEDYDHPMAVGGIVAKRGCSLVPSTQVAAPVPSPVEIHSDAGPSKLKVTVGTSTEVYDLQAAGHHPYGLDSGTARIESDDGTLGAAFVVGLRTTYYAITDERGHYRLDELAPGTYELTFWQAPLPKLVDGALTYGSPTLTKKKVTVAKAKTAKLDVSLGR